jgi:poly-beta-1,6-N-acetyl-D-glucosamine synthase
MILIVLPKKRKKPAHFCEDEYPFVTLLIPAYNEENSVHDKLNNALEQSYPKDRYEIILTSDGSTDNTVEIAKTFKDRHVNVVHSDIRRGKNMALNAAIENVQGDILVFTDANAKYSDDAIEKMVHHFKDPAVGLVCGHLKYYKGTIKNVGKGEGLYFRYESLLKGLESRHGAVAVVTGAIYAIRKDLFIALEPDVANDFAHPVQVGANGFKVEFEPEAKAYEKATESILQEFKRRSRIVTRGLTAFSKYRKSYHILRGFRGFCFLSHKLLRWFGPIFLLLLLISNFYLDALVLRLFLFGQIIFYTLAIVGVFLRGSGGKFVVVPFYFCMINTAALVGIVSFMMGKRQSIWDVASSTR